MKVKFKKTILILLIVAATVLSCEWLSDETNRFPIFPYTVFKALLSIDKIDQVFETIQLPENRNLFGRYYVHVWLKGESHGYCMFVPSDFVRDNESALKKTKAFRFDSCGNPIFLGFVLKLFPEIVISSLLIWCLRSKILTLRKPESSSS